MENSRFASANFLLLLLVICWCALAAADPNPVASCIQELMSCQPFLKAPSAPPPSCCQPLREIVADDIQCLCGVFKNSELLKSMNVTLDDGLNLAKSCGSNVHPASACHQPSSPAAPTNGSRTSSPATTAAATVRYAASYAVAATAILIVFAFQDLKWLAV